MRRLLAGSMLAAALAGCTTAATDEPRLYGLDRQQRHAHRLRPDAGAGARRGAEMGHRLRQGREGQDRGAELRGGAAGCRRDQAGGRRHAQGGRSIIRRTARCSPPSARRSPPTAGSRRRLPQSAAPSGRTIRTGSCSRPRAASSIRSASTTTRAPSTGRRWCWRPGEPQVLNNFGLSYALTGELDEAEKTLRQAAASPKATLKMRQNLAHGARAAGQGRGGQARVERRPDSRAGARRRRADRRRAAGRIPGRSSPRTAEPSSAFDGEQSQGASA